MSKFGEDEMHVKTLVIERKRGELSCKKLSQLSHNKLLRAK